MSSHHPNLKAFPCILVSVDLIQAGINFTPCTAENNILLSLFLSLFPSLSFIDFLLLTNLLTFF